VESSRGAGPEGSGSTPASNVRAPLGSRPIPDSGRSPATRRQPVACYLDRSHAAVSGETASLVMRTEQARHLPAARSTTMRWSEVLRIPWFDSKRGRLNRSSGFGPGKQCSLRPPCSRRRSRSDGVVGQHTSLKHSGTPFDPESDHGEEAAARYYGGCIPSGRVVAVGLVFDAGRRLRTRRLHTPTPLHRRMAQRQRNSTTRWRSQVRVLLRRLGARKPVATGRLIPVDRAGFDSQVPNQTVSSSSGESARLIRVRCEVRVLGDRPGGDGGIEPGAGGSDRTAIAVASVLADLPV
jgi:hypothetical protein